MPPFDFSEILAEFADAQSYGKERHQHHEWRSKKLAGLLESLRAWQELQRLKGLCVWCVKPRIPEHAGLKYPCCAEHKKKRRIYQQATSKCLRDKGWFTAYRKERVVAQKLRGRCARCTKPFDPSEITYKRPLCATHRAKERARLVAWKLKHPEQVKVTNKRNAAKRWAAKKAKKDSA